MEMMSRAQQLRRLAELAGELRSTECESRAAEVVVRRVVELVPDAEMASLTVRPSRGRFLTLASSHHRAEGLDELQYDLDEGPCVDAATEIEWLRSGDVERDLRWPRWGPRAAERGARSLLSVRIEDSGRSFGALNLYSTRPGVFSDRDEVDFSLLYAAHSAIALAAVRKAAGLTTALQTRHVIGVAQGILVERYGLDVDQSFALLRRYSNETNTRVADLARELVRTGRLQGRGVEV